ncbi:MAG: beta-N-acetylhexosaminidase [Alphaproteobacteria bacterium]|nr:beta-N-acetylhexosaminidase [Alphaproteobacteria bacterium]
MPPAERTPRAVILGLAGAEVTAEERAFFRAADPYGFILFQRNCVYPAQVMSLTRALRETVGRADAPILIDQEGGRVARLRPPHWRHPPPAAAFAELFARERDAALEAVRINHEVIARDLRALGIDVDCAPVLDVPAPGSHEVIGDRAFGCEPAQVAALGRAAAEGLMAGGVTPVIKHIPGHGRASVDSHLSLPRVGASRAELEKVDFAPFRALADLPWAMTGHVLYDAIDEAECATTSALVIGEVVRGLIGFQGLLLSDDLAMKALGGGYAERAERALAAGCDIALHCSGDMGEMKEVVRGARPMTEAAMARASRKVAPVDARFDRAGALARLAALLGRTVA